MICTECGVNEALSTGRCKPCVNRANGRRSAIALDEAYFRGRSEVEGECWVWNLSKSADGYGIIGDTVGGLGEQRAHRAAYRVLVDDVIVGEIDHTCRVRACVNPAHLRDVPHRENMRVAPHIAAQVARSTCASGHEYTPENTYIRADGARICRACQRTYKRRRNERLARGEVLGADPAVGGGNTVVRGEGEGAA